VFYLRLKTVAHSAAMRTSKKIGAFKIGRGLPIATPLLSWRLVRHYLASASPAH
jgi:hypothetical protein